MNLHQLRIRYTFRWLAVATSVICVAISLYAVPLAQLRTREAAIQHVQLAGGTLYFRRHDGAVVLRNLYPFLAEDTFSVAYAADISESRVNDRLFESLCVLSDLEGVTVSGKTFVADKRCSLAALNRLTSVTIWHPTPRTIELVNSCDIHSVSLINVDNKDGWRPIVRNDGLREFVVFYATISPTAIEVPSTVTYLAFHRCVFGEDAWEVVASPENLQHLRISGDGFGDKEIMGVELCNQIRCLDLSCSAVSDTGIKAIAELGSLERLNLSFTRVGNAGVSSLASLRNLKRLELRGTDVTGRVSESLSRMRSLTYIDLANTECSDDGLLSLASLPSLQTIVLDGTSVTKYGIDQFKVISDNKHVRVELDQHRRNEVESRLEF